MATALDVSRPTPLRLFGFLFTAVGGLLIALGSLLTWATVGIVSDTEGVFDSAIHGIDRAEGAATLAMGVAILIGLVALRVVASHAARRAVALLITVCAAGSTTPARSGSSRRSRGSVPSRSTRLDGATSRSTRA